MKKITLILLTFICLHANAQVSIAEPEFIGQIIALTTDSTGILLGKESGQVKTKAGASVYLTGIGSVKTRITLEGAKAKVQLPKADEIRLVIRCVDNQSDPLSIISVTSFEVKKDQRRAEIAKANTFGGSSSNTMDTIDFNAKKYGESSYLVVLSNLQAGEYGIMVSNPNAQDEKNSLMMNCFGVE